MSSPTSFRSPAPRPSIVHLPAAGWSGSLLDFLVERFPKVPRETWRQRFERGEVQGAQGEKLDPAQPGSPHLELRYFREVALAEEPDFGPPVIVFANAELVVADKPPFQPVTPSGPWVRSCLLYQVAAALAAEGEETAELVPLHRLDRATSGLVLMSRRAATRSLYGRLFEERKVAKVYEALAELPALPEPRSWTVKSRLVAGEPFFRMRETLGEPNAESEIELVETWEQEGRHLGRFELRPSTGKKHQLRIHMASLGFPILGDRYYPELQPEAADDPAKPLCLLARQLAFRDPVDGNNRLFTSRFAWAFCHAVSSSALAPGDRSRPRPAARECENGRGV